MIAWTEPYTADAPSARRYFAMAYDAVRDVTVLYGGDDGDYNAFDDTWEWDGTNWTEMSPVDFPSNPYGAAISMAWHAGTSKIIMFYSFDTPSTTDQTWEWDGTNWTLLSPATDPYPDSGAAWYSMASAPGGNVLLWGGNTTSGLSNQTATWDGTDWVVASPGTSPTADWLCPMAYDPTLDLTVLLTLDGNIWTWDGTDWANVGTGTAYNQGMASLAWHSNLGKLVLFGGYTAPSLSDQETVGFTGTAFSDLPVVATPQGGRGGNQIMAPDPSGDIVLFGGGTNSSDAGLDGTFLLTPLAVPGATPFFHHSYPSS